MEKKLQKNSRQLKAAEEELKEFYGTVTMTEITRPPKRPWIKIIFWAILSLGFIYLLLNLWNLI